MTRQEQKALGHNKKMLERLAGNRELMLHMQVKTVPGQGFILKDSFFSDHCESDDYDPNENDPNFGFKDPTAVTPHVYKKPALSIDDSPEEDDVGVKLSSEPEEMRSEDATYEINVFDGTAKPSLKTMKKEEKKNLREEMEEEEGNQADHFVITQIEKIYDCKNDLGIPVKDIDRPIRF